METRTAVTGIAVEDVVAADGLCGTDARQQTTRTVRSHVAPRA